jgi:hypothetical protein
LLNSLRIPTVTGGNWTQNSARRSVTSAIARREREARRELTAREENKAHRSPLAVPVHNASTR